MEKPYNSSDPDESEDGILVRIYTLKFILAILLIAFLVAGIARLIFM